MHSVVMLAVPILTCCIEGFRVVCNWFNVFLVTIVSVLSVDVLLGHFVSRLRYGIAFLCDSYNMFGGCVGLQHMFL